MGMSLIRRLRRHLSYANVIASVALFGALCGGAYAASSKINGGNIKNQTIAGKKLKNGTVTNKQIKKGTITSAQIKEGSLNSTVINVSTLGTVPSAETAGSAENATRATTAASAETAAQATNADSVGGHSADELTLSCPDETELYGGMCWDETVRLARNWIDASQECGDEGGRLPSLSELIAYIGRPGIQFGAHSWSSEVIDLETGVEKVLTSDETGRASVLGTATRIYRCLFYRSNE
jgi:hypothetical protein